MLAILDYDAGNIESVRLALWHVGGNPQFVKDAKAVAEAERIVFPGVGSARQCMANFISRGFDKALVDALERRIPVLAICIGMQLLFDSSEEDGGVRGLGILPGRVVRFRPDNAETKVPHMGWNHAKKLSGHPLLPDDTAGDDYYFVHSYYVSPGWNVTGVDSSENQSSIPPGVIYGQTDYAGLSFSSMAGKDSLFAVQFHPEKSAEAGLGILERFLRWDGRVCS